MFIVIVLLAKKVPNTMTTRYPFGILWSLYCLSFDLQILVTPLVSWGHCIVCPLIYRFWLPLGIFKLVIYQICYIVNFDIILSIKGQTIQ